MSSILLAVRRIVTANDARGRSYIAEDGPSSSTLTVAQRPGYRNTNLWCTVGNQPRIDAPDQIAGHSGVCPPVGGTVLRIVDVPPQPEDIGERHRQAAATFAAMYPDAKTEGQDGQHPGMHVTPTIDYAIVLQGELVAILDEGETLMRAGDVLIQRGTNHAWANRSNQVARIAFILVDATPCPE